MSSSLRSLRSSSVPLALLVAGLVALAALVNPTPAGAEGGAAAPPPQRPAMQGPNFDEGMRLFDEAVQYVARGQVTIPDVQDFYTSLQIKLELPEQRQEGGLKVWFANPDKFRQELTAAGGTTTKILAGEMAWAVDPTGRVSRLHGTADGAATIAQLKDDRTRLDDITKFLTLKGLKGPGIGFEFLGPTTGTGTYEGNWVKVVRRAPGRADITFWLSYTRDQAGGIHATWPGIVRVAGDVAKKIPTEDYILREWDAPQSQARSFRYPRRIEAYQIEPNARPARFLFALVEDIKINTGVDPARFAEPRTLGRP